MSLLNIEKLTLRFGGLTAVKDFSLRVKEHEIVSIIGPNGAGKTTVFNAVTGIYPPTTGEIKLSGQVIARPYTWRLWTACVLVGLCTALGLGLVSVNIDLLWRAAIRRPFNIELFHRTAGETENRSAAKFTYRIAAENAWSYLRGDLALEPVGRTWRVLSCDGRITLLRVPNETKARELLDALQFWLLDPTLYEAQTVNVKKIPHEGSPASIEGIPPDYSVSLSSLPVLSHLSSEQIGELGEKLREVRSANQRRHLYLFGGSLCGFLLGAAGYFSVWQRSRGAPDVISRGGIARTFQNIRLFHNMTVLENVLVGMDRKFSANIFGMIFRWPAFRMLEQARFREAAELLQFMGLDDRRETLAKNLPYGDQRRLEIARAMASNPLLLLLDEPAAGMNPAESEELMHLIRKIRDRGITILLIEHHMKLVMGISDRIAVLEYGVAIAEGTPEEVRRNPKVIEAYLGKEEVS